MISCPIKNSYCTNTYAWYKYSNDQCGLISSLESIARNLQKINEKLIEPNLEEINKTREINTAMALNNIEVQKKTAALLDKCSIYINKEIVRSQLEQEKETFKEE